MGGSCGKTAHSTKASKATQQTPERSPPSLSTTTNSSTRIIRSAPGGSTASDPGAGVNVAAKIIRWNINKDYTFESRVLGTGCSGPVKVAVHRKTGRRYAVKAFSKNSSSSDHLNKLRNEAHIYIRLDHPHVARLIAIYEDEEKVYLVMELCSGGELYDRLSASKVYSEGDARNVTKQMLSAIHYLHCHGVVHRDLKLENWLYDSEDSGACLKLIDFGFSKRWTRNLRRMQATCGTLMYCSPDVLLQKKGGYTEACDMWSLGVIVYMLLVGYPPFFGTEKKMFDDIKDCNYSFEGSRWRRVSASARGFVRQLLEVDPDTRMTSKDAMNHPWMAGGASPRAEIGNKVLTELKQFGQLHKLKRAALFMMAYALTSDEIRGFHEIFLSFDISREGTIRLEEMVEIMQSNLEISNMEVERIFRSLDSNGDREVYYNDFLAAMLRTRVHLHEHLIREAFNKFDTNNSGCLTFENLQDVLGSKYKDEALKEIIEEADIKKNGVIDYDEFLTLMLRSDGPTEQPEEKFLELVDEAVQENSMRHNSSSYPDVQPCTVRQDSTMLLKRNSKLSLQ